MKKIIFMSNAWEDLSYWAETDTKVFKKILNLIKECRRTPFSGTGNPEALKYQLTGYWSRRITPEHRMVYRVSDDAIEFLMLRNHY